MDGNSTTSILPPAIRAAEPWICSRGIPSVIALISSSRAI
jgi:hypothetical protein